MKNKILSAEELLKCGIKMFWEDCTGYNLSKVELLNYIVTATNNFEPKFLKLFISTFRL